MVNGREIKICECPEWISPEQITDLLHRSYKRNLDAGLNFAAATQSAQVTSNIMNCGKTLVALVDDNLIGTMTVLPHFDDCSNVVYSEECCVSLHMIAIDINWQGNKILEKMILEITKVYSETKNIMLDTSEKAEGLIRYYELLGFEIVKTHKWENTNYLSVVMNKKCL